ncbi:PRTRC system protein E (plasmid) [Pseudomonas cannabina pv. alisalensis]|uniref:PRTRC system protein E n=1 Tax=Pseudomonas syringae pv. maculicola str. ES4326 TaxID=629265 RepID=A0A8T8CBW2_PSEYM|nr:MULTISPECIES: PRTRC system protein E [Pseudomonas syringae group]QHF00644.1 PRTRC system protein E [Pseudomonas syringae pv. maculicola str. ES4326]UBZ00637.1 PRTRC system protein E [Pseudomonas cannabina pv. alisalensis]
MNTFLQSVGAVLTTGLKATIELHGLGDGKIKLLFTPDIGPTPENSTEAVVQLRSAIAKPMVVSGTPEEIEEAFAELIASKSAVVRRGLSALDEIERLANKAVEEAKSKPAAKAATPAPSGDESEDDADENGTDAPGLPEPVAPEATGTSVSNF